MTKPVIKAKTPEELKIKIVAFLRQQAHGYHRDHMLAERKMVKQHAQIKADCCMGLALFLEGCEIDGR